jgi:hypothetical protein
MVLTLELTLSIHHFMKGIIVATAALAVSTYSVFAGGFGGPAPFQNDSPLRSGIDGIYQASASGQNLTGIISFALESGIQTSNQRENSWIMFSQGSIFRGGTAVNVVDTNITGILDAGGASIPATDDGSLTLPIVFVAPSDRASGEFTGNIQLRSPTGKFSGKGTLYPTPAENIEIVGISEDVLGNISIVSQNVALSAGSASELSFRFNGVRKTTVTGVTAAGNSQQSN